MFSDLAQPKTPEERAEVAAANHQWGDFMNRLLALLNDACTQLGVIGLTHVVDLFDRSDRLLLAISRAFDFEAHSLPDNVRYVGPLLDQPSWSLPWRAPWSSRSERPRVLIACSTGSQGQGELLQRVLNAMGSIEIDAVATAGPNLNVADLQAPENVRLLQSAPHDSVMKEVSAVITQGGHGTINRALINGLPLLVLPMARDQGANAMRVEAKGAGLRLPPTASEAAIASAVNRLTTEPRFRASARRLGEAIRADIDASILVRELEAVAAAGRGAGTAARKPSRRASAHGAVRAA
jgi:UDP:flavonoid glycosyltransferase YjiC (YdhE family)